MSKRNKGRRDRLRGTSLSKNKMKISQQLRSPFPIQLSMSSRRRQAVSTLSERKKVIRWMINETGPNIAARAVDNPQFKHIFRNNDNTKCREANRKKAIRWWHGREAFIATIASERTLLLTQKG